MIAEPIARKPARDVWLTGAALILNIGLALSYAGLWLMLARQDMFWRADFSAYYTGWAMVRDGQGARLYDFDLQARYQQQILDGHNFSIGLLPYLNPPHATIPFVPLALLPRASAFWVWSAGQVGLVAWLLILLSRIARVWTPNERRLMLSAVLAFPLLLFTLQLGAFSLLLLVSLLQYYLALKHRRERLAGMWLLVGTIKPRIVLLPGLILVAARRRRALAAVILAGPALALLSGAILGWQVWPGFLNALRTANTYFTHDYVSAQAFLEGRSIYSVFTSADILRTGYH